jgi:hypothetical protein
MYCYELSSSWIEWSSRSIVSESGNIRMSMNELLSTLQLNSGLLSTLQLNSAMLDVTCVAPIVRLVISPTVTLIDIPYRTFTIDHSSP